MLGSLKSIRAENVWEGFHSGLEERYVEVERESQFDEKFSRALNVF